VKASLTAGLLLLAGCSFYSGYNGIYLANKYASDARRSARAGRPSEAAGYWGQAAVKAESLIARQPNGKYRSEALAIQGEALASLGRCGQAVTLLHEAFERASQDDVREETSLALGRCELALGQPESAAITLEPITHSRDDVRRGEARGMRARALLQTGDYETALAELRATGVDTTSSDVIGALAGLGRTEEVEHAFDALVARHDTMLVWDSVLANVGKRNPAVASRMLDRLSAAGVIDPKRMPALLGADAARLDGDARDRRLQQVAQLAPESEAGDAARLELTRRRLRAVASVPDLGPIVDTLQAIAAVGQPSAPAALLLAEQAATVGTVFDSVTPGMPQGDLRLFLTGELARDSLRATSLALQLFRRVVSEWPDGAYAPKALLAGRQLDPAWAEDSDSLLLGRYAENPYVIAARGGDRAGMRQLDDSMAAFERSLRPQPETADQGGAGAQRRPSRQDAGAQRSTTKKPAPKKGRQVEDLQ